LSLLLTKLFIPRLSNKVVKRETVIKKILTGYEDKHQLTLVCAPAGYGKTTVILEFLHSIDANTAWLSIDLGDNDPHRFLMYLVAALKKAGVAIGYDIDALIADAGLKATETTLTLIINSIAVGNHSVILVLDDYHIIQSDEVNKMIKFLLDHQPPNFHLIITTREDPQLPLARLRLKNMVTEVRMADLEFTSQEAAELFDISNGNMLSKCSVEILTQKTEGWIAGLQLASLLFKNRNDDQVENYIRNFNGTSNYIIDFLMEEVLKHQDPDLKDFLTKTSILERMNYDLCDEVTQRNDSRELLHRIEKANLFLIPLDDTRNWYRYHHLFTDSLKVTLSQEEESIYYKRAAHWMNAHGFSHEAVHYAFMSKDKQLAIQMVEDSVLEAFQNAQLESLVKWLALISDADTMASEVLCVRKAIALFVTGRTNEAIQYLILLDNGFLENASMHNKGLLLSIKAMIAVYMGQDAEDLSRQALAHLQLWDPISRTSSLNTLGRAQFQKGCVGQALDTFKCAYAEGLKIGYQFITMLALMNYSMCLHTIGQSEEALSLCDQTIQEMIIRFDKLPPYIGVIYVVLSELYDGMGEKAKSAWYEEKGTALCESISYDVAAYLKLFANSGAGKAADSASEKRQTASSESERKDAALEYGAVLSQRELEILILLGKGLSNREIANSLFVTINTIQWHISNIYSKLGVKSRTQALFRGKELGIL
jgi:LuxR family maltose regulon positive regulatory protein